MDGMEKIAFCGVDCSVCPDFTRGECPSCRETQWTDEDVCRPVGCCREKGIDVCGQCEGFPCGMMAGFYEESEAHRQAGRLMSQWNKNPY